MRSARRLLAAAAAWAASAAAPGCGDGAAPAADAGAAARTLAEADKLASRHRVAEALALVESALAARGGSAGAAAGPELALLERQGTLLLSLGRPREAAAILARVAGVKPGDPATRRWLARAHLESGECAEAARAFASLPAPLTPEVLVELGNALAGSGREDEGMHAIAAALIRDPWLDAGYLACGRALARRGRAGNAKVFLERYRAAEGARRGEQEALAFEAAGDEARAHQRRARIERERGRLFSAMELHNRALGSNPGLGEAYLDLARLSIFLARPADAIQALEKLPRDERVVAVLDEARAAAADSPAGPPAVPPEAADAALAILRREIAGRIRTKPLSRSAGDLVPLAAALARAGRSADARALALFLLRLDPGNLGARLAVLELFDRPDDAFVRLWALEGMGDAETARRFAVETADLGLEPATLRSFLGRAAAPLKP